MSVRTSVDLPEPESPMTTNTSPGQTSIETSRTATTQPVFSRSSPRGRNASGEPTSRSPRGPKTFQTPSARMTGGARPVDPALSRRDGDRARLGHAASAFTRAADISLGLRLVYRGQRGSGRWRERLRSRHASCPSAIRAPVDEPRLAHARRDADGDRHRSRSTTARHALGCDAKPGRLDDSRLLLHRRRLSPSRPG